MTELALHAKRVFVLDSEGMILQKYTLGTDYKNLIIDNIFLVDGLLTLQLQNETEFCKPQSTYSFVYLEGI